MIDRELRTLKDRLADPVARRMAPLIAPGLVTSVALVVGLAAALAAARGSVLVSVALWLLNRVLDGLDGAIARRRDRATDLGGYLDIIADTVVYAAVPLGVAVAVDSRAAWVAAAALLATFYVNSVSWAYLAGLLEKRGAGTAAAGDATSLRMPRGLVEGAETILLFSVMLAVPHRMVEVATLMAGLVVVTVLQRLMAARSMLREHSDTRFDGRSAP